MAALLQEIVSVYPLLVPPQLTGQISNRVCNALALLQCVASHSETRGLFLNGLLEFMINLLIYKIYLLILNMLFFSSHSFIFVPISQYNEQD